MPETSNQKMTVGRNEREERKEEKKEPEKEQR
jgi:hypothetical protein